MSRPIFTFHSNDISTLARSLVKQWAEEPAPPGHVQMLNMLARAVGFENFQHFRVEAETAQPSVPALPTEDARDETARTIKRLMRHFDDEGRLMRWPNKFSEQQPCLWPVWARIPARRDLRERDVNEAIKLGESFGDHVLLRRELVTARLLTRTPDGSVYRRLEQAPPELAGYLIREIMQKAREA
jgi:hypothetical protein